MYASNLFQAAQNKMTITHSLLPADNAHLLPFGVFAQRAHPHIENRTRPKENLT